ncbi:MAG: sulfite exporter TauE/SafE family protein [Peptococcaceae bacterium]
MIEQLVLLSVITFSAGLIQAISGFAFGIIFIGFSQYIIGYTSALALNALLSVFFLSYLVHYYRKYINFSIIKVPIVVTGVTILIAQRLYCYVELFPYWNLLLGILFILMGSYMAFRLDYISEKPKKNNAVFFSIFTGILQGFFGVGGPPMTIYFLSVTDTKEEYLGSDQFLFLMLCLVDFGGRIVNSLVPKEIWSYFPICLICLILGVSLGTALLKKIKINFMRKLVYALVILDGCYLIIQTICR